MLSLAEQDIFSETKPVGIGKMQEQLWNRPIVLFAFGVLCGTWVGLRAPWELFQLVALSQLFGFALMFVVCTLVLRKRPQLHILRILKGYCIVCFAFCLAFINSATDTAKKLEQVELVRELMDIEEEPVLRGTVMDEPSFRDFEHGGARIRFRLAVTQIPYENDLVEIEPLPVVVDWYGPSTMQNTPPPFPLPKAGEGWQIAGTLREVETASATPFLTLRKADRDKVTRPYPELNEGAWRRRLWAFRARAAESLKRGSDEFFPHSSSLVRAMVLGFRSDVPQDVNIAFRNSGTVHVFAISGLHVGIVAAMLLGLLALLRIPDKQKPLLLIPLIFLYVLLTGARPSALRAAIMCSIMVCGLWVDRPAKTLVSLWIAAAVILLLEPSQLLDLGFVFSFTCCAGIVLFVEPLQKIIRLPRRRCIRKELLSLLIVSIATWAVSAPLSAYCFGRLSPISVLANIVIIPVAECVVQLAALSVFVQLVSAPLAYGINFVTGALTELMIRAAQVAALVPGGTHDGEPWGWGGVAAWYAVLLLLYFLSRNSCQRR